MMKLERLNIKSLINREIMSNRFAFLPIVSWFYAKQKWKDAGMLMFSQIKWPFLYGYAASDGESSTLHGQM